MDDAHNPSIIKSIATRLMRVSFTWYLVIAISVTLIHTVIEYHNTKEKVYKEIKSYEKIFGPQLAASLWDLDTERIQRIVKGMVQVPIIEGVIIQDTASSKIIGTPDCLNLEAFIKTLFICI